MQIGLSLGISALRGGGVPLDAVIEDLFANDEVGVWYDPSDLTTMFQDTAGTTPVTTAGQAVARINDKSGNGLNATQVTANRRPTYQTNGTYHWLEFDGVNDALVTSTLTPTTNKMQFFAGLKRVGDGVGSAVLAELSANSNSVPNSFAVFAPITSATIKRSYGMFARGSSAATCFMDDNSFPVPTTNVLTCLADISGDMARVRVDGTQVKENLADQGTGATYASDKIYIGSRNEEALPIVGNIYSLVIRFGPNLTSGQIAEAETYVNSKTGAF